MKKQSKGQVIVFSEDQVRRCCRIRTDSRDPVDTYGFFYQTSAVNPSLTIIVKAIRIAGHMLQDRLTLRQIL
jgi:hypothetical protein